MPAAHIRFTPPGGKVREDWVVAGIESLGIPSQTAVVDEHHVIGLMEQEAKAFRSHLIVQEPGKKQLSYILEVNKPVPINSWMLYQNSYEITMGGRTSIIEAIRDPALPVVYSGLIAMMFGAFIALWINYGKRNDSTLETSQTSEVSI